MTELILILFVRTFFVRANPSLGLKSSSEFMIWSAAIMRQAIENYSVKTLIRLAVTTASQQETYIKDFPSPLWGEAKGSGRLQAADRGGWKHSLLSPLGEMIREIYKKSFERGSGSPVQILEREAAQAAMDIHCCIMAEEIVPHAFSFSRDMRELSLEIIRAVERKIPPPPEIPLS